MLLEIPHIDLDTGRFAQRQHLRPRIHLRVVGGLVHHVPANVANMGGANRKCGIAFLPGESRAQNLIVYPGRRRLFDRLENVAHTVHRLKRRQDVNVIRNTPDRDRDSADAPDGTAEIGGSIQAQSFAREAS